MSDNNSSTKSLSKKNIKIIIIIIIIIIILVIVGVLAYFLTKSNNTSDVPKQIEQSSKNNKPWQTKSVCEKYKKDYIDSCTEKYNKNLIPQTAFKGCFEFADGYYDCQNYN